MRMEDVAATVRRVDEDRWLASRFAPTKLRERLISLYAVNYEIARSAETVSTPALGDIRHAWWRDALDEIHDGKPARSHPALDAYADAHAQTPFLRQPWSVLIAARSADLEPAPFESFDALTRYVDATAGALMHLAVAALSVSASAQTLTFIQPAARAWGYAGLFRAAPVWAARGRSLGVDLDALKHAGLEAYAQAKALAPAIPTQLFPAFGYVCLARRYLRAPDRAPLLLERQARLVAASATGRL
jgi:phytoene synthase